MRDNFSESVERVFQRHGVYYKFGAEAVHLVERCEALRIVHKAQPLGVGVVHGRLVLEAEQVDEKRAHLACA